MEKAAWSAFCALLIVHLGGGWSEQSGCCSSQSNHSFVKLGLRERADSALKLDGFFCMGVHGLGVVCLGILHLGTN